MGKISYNTVISTIDKNIDIINFGDSDGAPKLQRILETEEVIGKKLPKSYLWFLINYGGGEICGNEVYSIYDNSLIPSGDLVYHYLLNKKTYKLDENYVEFFHTDFAESFYFNYYEYDGEEAPIFKRVGLAEGAKYADNFYEFLFNHISECVS